MRIARPTLTCDASRARFDEGVVRCRIDLPIEVICPSDGAQLHLSLCSAELSSSAVPPLQRHCFFVHILSRSRRAANHSCIMAEAMHECAKPDTTSPTEIVAVSTDHLNSEESEALLETVIEKHQSLTLTRCSIQADQVDTNAARLVEVIDYLHTCIDSMEDLERTNRQLADRFLASYLQRRQSLVLGSSDTSDRQYSFYGRQWRNSEQSRIPEQPGSTRLQLKEDVQTLVGMVAAVARQAAGEAWDAEVSINSNDRQNVSAKARALRDRAVRLGFRIYWMNLTA